MEIWKVIPAYNYHYEASNKGRVRSLDKVVIKYSNFAKKIVEQKYKGRILKGAINNGYIFHHIGFNKKNHNMQAGRLVLLAFCGHPKEGQECCHNNGDKLNNNIENLRWDSHLENNRDRVRHGTYKTGKDHHFNKFSDKLKDNIRSKKISRSQAFAKGVSITHYYRLLKSLPKVREIRL